jgi:hypothetical protein
MQLLRAGWVRAGAADLPGVGLSDGVQVYLCGWRYAASSSSNADFAARPPT